MTDPGSKELRPHRGVRADRTSPGCFVAEGADPQMLWNPAKRARSAFSGRRAVKVTLAIRVLEGRLTDPCVYVDWGDGFSEETRSRLRQSEPGAYTTIAHSNAGAFRRVRVDPSSTPCRFELLSFDVEPAMGPSPNLPQLSTARRMARRVLRRLPRPLQHRIRTARALVRGDRPSRSSPRLFFRRLLGWGLDPWRRTYIRAFEVSRNLRSPDFAAPPLEPPRRDPLGARVVAFYLPQFHPIPQNDVWWGRGFTEWTNVSKATPQFEGHLQPRLPGDLGYYDLRVPEVRRAQADLARRMGVDAFCFHYYWFGGQRLLEAPLDAFVADPELETPFALCWANENWTRRWDGLENEVLIGQQHSPQDDVAVLNDIARYMRSPRYLRIGGRPLVLIYRPDILPDAAATLTRWRTQAREIGVGELFLACTNAFGFADYRDYGFDAIVDFPPHAISVGEITEQVERLNPAFSGKVYDYDAVVEAQLAELHDRDDARRIAGVMPAWDNEARKPGAGNVFHNATPELFRRWAEGALAFAQRTAPAPERLLFVNAWNEWAEGAYLEPDRWFGHGFGQALRAALEARAPRLPSDHPLVVASQRTTRSSDAVLLLHIHYSDLIEEFATRLAPASGLVDLAITFPNVWTQAELRRLAAAFPAARLEPVENRGRDLAPFVRSLASAREAGYGIFCKLHSKRSPHIANGDLWRDKLTSRLIGDGALSRALAQFSEQPRLGLLAPTGSAMRLGEPGVLHNNQQTFRDLAQLMSFTFDEQTPFVAGTMFWGRVAAFERLLSDTVRKLPFEVEMGRIDGTLAHAMERSTCAIVLAAGYQVEFSL